MSRWWFARWVCWSWARSFLWAPATAQAIVPGGDDLRIEKLVYASFSGTYPEVDDQRDVDEWSLMTATFVQLVVASVRDDRGEHNCPISESPCGCSTAVS
jgi:hypothetical protein